VAYTAAGAPTWASNTGGKNTTGEVSLHLQNDGNLVLYSGSTATWASNTVQVEKKNDRLGANETLHHNQQIVSADGRYRAVVQSDGNFVVYEGGKATWASNTPGSGSTVLSLQSDGNLVLYDHHGKPTWASNTGGKNTSGDLSLVMQNDGNLVVYSGSAPTWASKSSGGHQEHKDRLHANGVLKHNEFIKSQNGQYTAVMQGDGNFVLYHGGRPLWASNTGGSASVHTVLQGDGNLVTYTAAGAPTWAAGTGGKNTSGDLSLVMQNDGNLVIYSGSTATWASNTAGQ